MLRKVVHRHRFAQWPDTAGVAERGCGQAGYLDGQSALFPYIQTTSNLDWF